MWRSSWARVLVWFVALAGLGLCALAQENTGNIYGKVADEKGDAVPGGTATLTGPHAPRSTTIDTNGNFRFLKVPPAVYKVRIDMPGFAPWEQEKVVVALGKNTDVAATLRLANVQETVTVTGSTPLIDTRKVGTGVTFSTAEMTEIPTARDIYALMQQTPGIQMDTVNVAGAASGVSGGPSFASKGSGGVTYQVDGASVTDNTYGTFNGGQARANGGTNTFFDFDTFDQVEVSTGGSLLDLQQPGTTINVVTKRGTNELKGSARYLYASDRWQSSNLPQEAIDQEFETDSTRFIREYGAEVGGPIIKDRLWLWGSGSRQDIALNLTGNSPEGSRVTSNVKLQPWAAKLNAQIVSSNALGLYYQRSNRTEKGSGNGPYRTPATLRDLLIPTDFYKLDDSQVFDPNTFASFFLSYQYPTYDHIPAGGLGTDVYMDVDGVYQDSYNYYIAKNPQYQASVSASKFFNTGNVNHELKFGFSYRRQINDSATGFPGDQLYGSDYYGLALIARNVRTVYKTEFFGYTLGDTITAGNLTINAGIRYSQDRGKNLTSSAAGNPVYQDLLPPVIAPAQNFWAENYKNWQPRASLGYALGKNRTTQLRASYARYADQLGFLTYQLNGVPITSGLYYYWTDTNGNHHVDPEELATSDSNFYGFYQVDPSVAPTPANAFAPDFKTPLTDEITAGFDQQIFEDFAVSATYTYRHVKDFQYRVPLGSTPDTWVLGGRGQGTAVADNGFSLSFDEPFYLLDLADRPTGDLFLNRPGATQTFHGIEVSFVKRLSNKWMLRASGSWMNWKQQIPPEAVLDPNNRWDLAGQNEDGGAVVGYTPKGSMWINARWQFNVTGMYQFPWGINASANFFGREGYPKSYYFLAPHPLEEDTKYILIGNIDQFRLENVYELDLRLEKTFNIGQVSITPMAECFNVTNANAILDRNGRTGTVDYDDDGNVVFDQSSNFNKILEVQSPRILRLGLRIAF
jgi:Carboxypeptidase regulatory-like domain/TonB-dependent Receptor Plug Domain